MKTVWKRFAAGFLAAALALSLTACGGGPSSSSEESSNEEDTSLSAIQNRGKLIVGMNAEFAPYEFHIMENGEDKLVGMDIEIAQAIADDMGVELEIKELAFDALITALNAGQVDILISGLSATEKRQKQIDFSEPYYKSKTVAMIHKKNADQYKILDDLKDKKLGVQLSSLQQQAVNNAFPDKPDDEYMLIESMNTLMLALKADQIDALVTADIVCKQAMVANPEFTVAEGPEFNLDFLNSPGAAVGIRKGSDALKTQLDSTIIRLKDEGKIDEFMNRAFEIAANNVDAEQA